MGWGSGDYSWSPPTKRRLGTVGRARPRIRPQSGRSGGTARDATRATPNPLLVPVVSTLMAVAGGCAIREQGPCRAEVAQKAAFRRAGGVRNA